MRFLLYNIRYGTGGEQAMKPWKGYLKRTTENTESITAFIQSMNPDIVGLLEVDGGSYRFARRNQAHHIAGMLGHYHSYQRKYGQASVTCRLPVLRDQGNAFIVRDRIRGERFHYFNKGMKKLVIELQLAGMTVFLVHLALGYRTRHSQLRQLADLVNSCSGPHIVAGDFNLLRGGRELVWFLDTTGLQDAGGADMLTFPSWKPNRKLDYILHSAGIRITDLFVPRVVYSDHLPLVCDFEIREEHGRFVQDGAPGSCR